MEEVFAFLGSAGKLLPVTVISAIVLFGVKEFLETRRRRGTNSRKRRALRRLLADEVERNNFQIRRLRGCCATIQRALAEGYLESDSDLKLKVIEGAFGKLHLKLSEEGQVLYQSPIGTVHTEVLSGSLLELALVDKEMFETAMEASDGAKELDGLRHSMVDLLQSHDHTFLPGFPDYALSEIDKIERTLKAFYKGLTGKELVDIRVF